MAKPIDQRALRDHEIPQTLVDDLIPVADDIRQLYTDFGLRPYRVFMVWVGWVRDVDGDGMLQGDELLIDEDEDAGRAVLLHEMELLPTPLVSGLGGISGTLDATGVSESGTVTVSQISMSLTEDELQGLLGTFRHPDYPDTLRPGVQFFYEIQENRPARYQVQNTAGSALGPADLRSPRRRFHLTGAPSRAPDAFEWTITLTRADGERDRDGDVRGVENTPDVDDDEE